jgi:hypothetical protein
MRNIAGALKYQQKRSPICDHPAFLARSDLAKTLHFIRWLGGNF